MKKACVLLFVVLCCSLGWAQINSTAQGGNWDNPDTWIGGVVPGSGDIVVINGTVYAGPATPCLMLTVATPGVLMNIAGTEGGVLIEYHLINYGTIQNYAWGYNPGTLSLVIGGNLQNYGAITNHTIQFNSFSPQTLANAGNFNPANLTDGMSSSSLILDTDLVAGPGTNIDLNGSLLVLDGGGPHNLTLQYSGGRGKFSDAIVSGGGGCRIIGVSGPNLELVTADEIRLEGSFSITSFTAGILHNYASLYCPIYGSGDLIVQTTLDNRGSISNHPAGGSLNLYLNGDLYNYGTLNNRLLSLQGAGSAHLLMLDAAAPAIACATVSADAATGGIMLLSDLRLEGCIVALNGAFLVLNSGSEQYDLIQNGGHIESAEIIADGDDDLILNGLYLQDCTIHGGTLYGSFEIRNTLNLGDVVNYATIQNTAYSSAELVSNVTLANHGILRNHPMGGTLHLSLGLVFFNYGTVTLAQITLAGNDETYLWQDAAAPAIGCPLINADSPAHVTHLISDITLSNSDFDLAGSTLALGGGGAAFQLKLYNSYLRNGNVLGDNSGSIYGAAGLLSALNIDRLITYGEMYIYGTVNVGQLQNHADLRNRNYWQGTLLVGQRLENYQVTANSLYGNVLYVEIAGDLYNYGILSVYRVLVNGSQNQYIRNGGSISTSQGFQLVSELGASAWYFNGELNNPGPVQNYSVNPTWLGIWQPFLAGVFGRTITFGAGSALGAPANLTLRREGSALKLEWDQVANASYYTVYASASPQGTFSVLQNHIVDNDQGDGVVSLTVNPSQPARFFKVTAAN